MPKDRGAGVRLELSPSHWGGGCVSPPQKIIWCLEMAYFDAFIARSKTRFVDVHYCINRPHTSSKANFTAESMRV